MQSLPGIHQRIRSLIERDKPIFARNDLTSTQPYAKRLADDLAEQVVALSKITINDAQKQKLLQNITQQLLVAATQLRANKIDGWNTLERAEQALFALSKEPLPPPKPSWWKRLLGVRPTPKQTTFALATAAAASIISNADVQQQTPHMQLADMHSAAVAPTVVARLTTPKTLRAPLQLRLDTSFKRMEPLFPVFAQVTARSKYVNAPFLLAVATQESEGDSTAISPRNAKGLFQFVPSTAKYYFDHPKEVFSGTKSVEAAAAYYDDLMEQYKGYREQQRLALAAYHSGAAVVNKALREITENEGAQKQLRWDQIDRSIAQLPEKVTFTGKMGAVTVTVHKDELRAYVRRVSEYLPVWHSIWAQYTQNMDQNQSIAVEAVGN